MHRITKSKTPIVLALFIICGLVGCDDTVLEKIGRYSCEKDAIGNLFVLDTKTGKILSVNASVKIEIPLESSLDKFSFGPMTIPGYPILMHDFRVKYLDGMLLYQGKFSPLNSVGLKYNTRRGVNDASITPTLGEALQKSGFFDKFNQAWPNDAFSHVTLHLKCADGFRLSSIVVRRTNLTRTVDDQSNDTGFTFQGSEAINLTRYRAIASSSSSYSMSWNLNKWDYDPNDSSTM